jgi:hypothetical protein
MDALLYRSMLETEETMIAPWWCEWLVSGAARLTSFEPPSVRVARVTVKPTAAFAAMKHWVHTYVAIQSSLNVNT